LQIIHPELKKEKKNIVKTRCEKKILIIGRLKSATTAVPKKK